MKYEHVFQESLIGQEEQILVYSYLRHHTAHSCVKAKLWHLSIYAEIQHFEYCSCIQML